MKLNQRKLVNVMIISSIFLLGLYWSQFPQSNNGYVSTVLSSDIPVYRISGKVATITVTAGDKQLVAKTPIIINASEFTSSIALATAIVKDGTTNLPTQYDKELKEFVFQLPNTIAAGSSATFDLYTDTTGTSNGQSLSIKLGQGLYKDTYADWLPAKFNSTFINASTGQIIDPAPWLGPNAIDEVIWVETDWAIMCLHVAASWRQSTWKHVILKDESWDAVNANYNASTNEWRWGASIFQDADPGWHHQFEPDTITIAKVGPVRALIQITSSVGYNGSDWTVIPWPYERIAVNATRTYTVYDDFSGIAQNFRLTGEKATEAAIDFKPLFDGNKLVIKHQIIDGGFDKLGSNNLTQLYAPGHGVDYRVSNAQFDLSKVTDSFIAAYNTSNYGFVYNWGPYNQYKNNISNIEWSTGFALFGIFYSLDYLPLEGINRYYIPFSGGAVTGSITDYIGLLNDHWLASYSITENILTTTTTTTTTTSEPTDTSSSTTKITSANFSPIFAAVTFIIMIYLIRRKR